MYCVIIGTRTDFRNGGICYDFLSCNSPEIAIKKLFNYHKSNCSGNINCNNCYIYDKEQKEIMRGESECRIYCKKCLVDEELQEEYCSKCKYCENCDECVAKQCDECVTYCDNCEFDGTLRDLKIPDYEESHIRVKIFRTDKEIDIYGNWT